MYAIAYSSKRVYKVFNKTNGYKLISTLNQNKYTIQLQHNHNMKLKCESCKMSKLPTVFSIRYESNWNLPNFVQEDIDLGCFGEVDRAAKELPK